MFCILLFSSAAGATKLAIADTKLYVPVVTLLAKDNAKLLQQIKSDVKETINWNKYQSKLSVERQSSLRLFNWS